MEMIGTVDTLGFRNINGHDGFISLEVLASGKIEIVPRQISDSIEREDSHLRIMPDNTRSQSRKTSHFTDAETQSRCSDLTGR